MDIHMYMYTFTDMHIHRHMNTHTHRIYTRRIHTYICSQKTDRYTHTHKHMNTQTNYIQIIAEDKVTRVDRAMG